ncbi:MAG: hypothetical protein JWR12_2277 [Mucilaginibacter sp.]|nr:hypothetical protein [Mucilaginibacter sp.]
MVIAKNYGQAFAIEKFKKDGQTYFKQTSILGC